MKKLQLKNFLQQKAIILWQLFFVLCLTSLSQVLHAQTPQFYNTDATATSNSFPLSSTTSNKVQWIYAPGVFNSAGTTGTPAYYGNITTVYIKVGTASATATYSNFYIKLGQNVGTATNYGTTSNTAYPFNTGLTTCYYAATKQLTGIVANTWYPITLQTPFTYDPSLALIMEIQVSGGTGNSVSQVSTTGQMQRCYGLYTAVNGTSNTGLVKLGIDLVSSAVCTSPPTAGTSTSSLSSVCTGLPTNLNLTGNSVGTGQTYQWQSSSTLAGPYTNIGAANTTSALTVNPTSSTYYQCEVTCSGISSTSTPVFVSVPTPFPGGTYTINSALPTGGTNFQTFAAAVSAISCGISGPVIFDVDPASGPYTEQITLPASIGSNAINTVTFNGNGRTIQFASTNSNARHVIKLDGADYITFNELNIIANTGTYGWGIHFTNGADYNSVNLCNITTSITDVTAGNFQPIAMSNSSTSTTATGNNGSYNTFVDNTLIGGYYGVTLCGNAAGTENIGNSFTSNNIRDFYSYGIYMTYQKGSSISTCDLSRPNRTASTTTAGVYMTTGSFGNLVENTRIHNYFDAMTTNTSTFYGVYEGANGTATDITRVINNVIYNIESAGSIYGIYNSGASYENIYHNTISLDHTSATAGLAYGVYQTTVATNINVRNNIITISRGGTGAKVGLYYNTNTSSIVSNNNVIFLNSAGTGTQNIGSSGATGFATLTAWQAANGGVYDANSVDFNPVYTAPGSGDFTPTAITTNNIGANVGVLYDISGNPRSATPDPGAYEYTLSGLDAGIVWVSPTSPTTAGLKTITVNITNNLSTPITSLVLSYTDGITPVTETFSGLSLAPSTSQTFSFSVQYNVTGNAVLFAYINSVNGVLDDAQSNDTTNNINLCVSMSGAYTINAGAPVSATNFQSFTALAATLNCGGVTGPVTVDVVAGSGPYNEQVSINAITGSSFVNTVTINGNNNTLTFPSGTNYYTLRLNGADNMTWNNLNINTTGASTGIALNLASAADFNSFNNCNFSVPTTLTGTGTSCVAFSSSSTAATGTGNNGNNNIFSTCTMTGGYYCVAVYGNTTANITGNQFLGCTIQEYYVYGLYNAYAGTTIVRDCIFERPTRATVSTGYGVYFTTNSVNCLIERNRVRKLFGGATTSTSTGYGLACVVASTVGNENKFYNNLISDIQSNGTLYGIYLSGASYSQAYHNTISLDATTSTGTTTTYGIYSTGTAGVDCKNNIVSISRGGTGSKYCLYYSPISGVASNNNDLYMNAAAGTNYIAYDGTTNFATLAAYQTVNTTKDQQSVSVNPSYANPLINNYQPTEATLDNLGTNVGVTLDINSVTRGAIPDIGAYEFSVAPIDAGVFAIVSPGTSGCYSNSETITVTIKNYGANTIDFAVNPLTVQCDITGATSTTLTGTPTGTLASGATMTVTLGPVLDMTLNGTYNMNIYTVLTGDGNSSNDALTPSVSRIVGPVGGTISSSLPSICVSGTPVLSLTGNYGGSIQWQESTVGASGPWTNIGTGTSTYTPSSPVTQTTYYQVEVSCNGNTALSNTLTVVVNNPLLLSTTPGTRCGIGTVNLNATVSAGATANWYANATGGLPLASGTTSFTTPTISSTTNFYVAPSSGGLTTNVGRPTNLTPGDGTNTGTNTVGIMFDAISALTINTVVVYPYSATAGTAGSITIGLQTSAGVTLQTTSVSVTGNPTPIATTVPLNFNVPPGTGYRLLWMTPNTGVTALYREFTATPFNFPYTVPGVISLTSSYTSGASLAYYYYFYDWSISTGCEGPRTAVAATVTTPPAITASAADPILCPSSSTTISVSSPNDPDYTYDWTSSPGTFTATGAGPHTVSPTTTTIYTVTATDNTTGPNAGCANVATVTITTAPAITAGTLSTSVNSYCVSGSPVLNVTGAAGGLISFQSSSSATGPWTTVSSGTASTYTPSSPLTATTYFRVEVTCGAGSAVSNVLTITISSPQVSSTIPGSRCGVGTVNLGATVGSGITAKWYAAPTGGPILGTGTSFTTPTIASTTSFYVEPVEGIGGADSVAVPLASGTTTGVYHNMFVVNSPTGMTLNAIGIKCNNTLGTLTAWDVYYRPDNYQLVSGSNLSSTGWTLLTSATNVSSVGATDYTYISLGNNLTLPPGATYSFYIAPASGSTHQYGTTAAGTTVTSNANATIIAGHRGSTLFNCNTASGIAVVKLKYSLGCVGTRVPVVATINTPPAMTVTTADPTLCPGGTTTVSVSSSNPDYSYSWTSNPSGFAATGVGPHTVSPTITTKYYVSAIDNTSGSFAGCTNLDSVTVITSASLLAGTVSSSVGTICISGAPTLTNTGSSGGAIQWQSSTTSATGPWTNVGTGSATYNPGTITQTTYYRVEVSCQSTSVQSNVVTVTVNDPQIVSTIPGVVCATSGSAVISATASAGADVKWYDVATGGTSLGSGSSFTTPTISATTTYYAEPNIGGVGGTASPIQVTEMDLGANDQLEIQNVSPDPIDVTGWKVAIGNSYSDITSVNANVQTLSGIMAPGAIMKWTDNTAGPNYWGSNILWNPGAYPTYTGWAAILDNNNILKDIVFLNWPAANIGAASITVGTTVITVGSLWTGNGIDQTTVVATNSVSRQGTSDNNNASDFAIVPLSLSSTNPGMTIPFTGFGCVGSRVPVVVTVGPCNSTLNLSLYIQGYYDGSIGSMLPVLANQFEPTTATACDSIDVELRDATTYGIVQSVRTVLNQNGTAVCTFPPVSGSYYVAVKHRNGLQTWSANPIAIASTPVTYDFTTAANQAYGDNQIEVASGVWAFYSGDVVTDENMDLLDIGAVEVDINNFASGYVPTDINGDGNVDLLDSPPVETNINNFVFSIHP